MGRVLRRRDAEGVIAKLNQGTKTVNAPDIGGGSLPQAPNRILAGRLRRVSAQGKRPRQAPGDAGVNSVNDRADHSPLCRRILTSTTCSALTP
jgi:hypothetical protein